MNNNAIGVLQTGISSGALTLNLTALPGFSLPEAGAVERIQLVDRLDSSRTMSEIILVTSSTHIGGGVYQYTVPSGGRNTEGGAAALAWSAGAYAIQVLTKEQHSLLANGWAMRTQSMLVHDDNAAMHWDGATFIFSNFRALGSGGGRHASAVGYIDISMPTNGSVAVGYGGASNITAASGGWPIPANTSLYYEPVLGTNLGSTVASNFRLVGFLQNFIVPPHWILIATNPGGLTAYSTLRLGSGQTLAVWHTLGAAGEPTLQNGWSSTGGGWAPVGFQKSAGAKVYLRGLISGGTATLDTLLFTLPVGFRPKAYDRLFPIVSNDAAGSIAIKTNGEVRCRVIHAAWASLDGIIFEAAA